MHLFHPRSENILLYSCDKFILNIFECQVCLCLMFIGEVNWYFLALLQFISRLGSILQESRSHFSRSLPYHSQALPLTSIWAPLLWTSIKPYVHLYYCTSHILLLFSVLCPFLQLYLELPKARLGLTHFCIPNAHPSTWHPVNMQWIC